MADPVRSFAPPRMQEPARAPAHSAFARVGTVMAGLALLLGGAFVRQARERQAACPRAAGAGETPARDVRSAPAGAAGSALPAVPARSAVPAVPAVPAASAVSAVCAVSAVAAASTVPVAAPAAVSASLPAAASEASPAMAAETRPPATEHAASEPSDPSLAPTEPGSLFDNRSPAPRDFGEYVPTLPMPLGDEPTEPLPLRDAPRTEWATEPSALYDSRPTMPMPLSEMPTEPLPLAGEST